MKNKIFKIIFAFFLIITLLPIVYAHFPPTHVYYTLESMRTTDSPITRLCKDREEQVIYGNLGADVPVHFSRFWPQYKLTNLAPTPVSTLEKAKSVARNAGLNYVYIGNVPGHQGETTFCPVCKRALIVRKGYTVTENNLLEGRCPFCKAEIKGVWS